MAVSGSACDRQDTGFFRLGYFEPLSSGDVRSHGVNQPVSSDLPGPAINCVVTPKDDGFYVGGFVQLYEAPYSFFSFNGQVHKDNVPENKVTVSFLVDNQTYNTTACTLSYATPQHHIQPGELWAQISCPDAAAPSAIVPPPVRCDVVTTIRFRECQ